MRLPTSRPPTSLGGKRSPGFQPHRQACHLTISGSEEEPPSDQYLLSVFTVFSFKKQQQKMGEKTTQKNKKKKTQHKTDDGFSFIFFLFLFFPSFFWPMARRWDAFSTEDSCPYAFPTVHNLQAARCSPDATAPPQPPQAPAGRGCPCVGDAPGPHVPSRGGLRSRGNGVVGRGQIPLGAPEPQNPRRQAQPLLPRSDCGQISVLGFFQCPLNVWVSSLPLQEDFEEWVGEVVGAEILCVRVCLYV